MKMRFTAVSGMLLLVGTGAVADELFLKNGSRLVGTLVSAEANVVNFDTPFAGTISVKEENIQRVVTDSGVTILLDDGQILRDRQINAGDGRLIASGEGEPNVLFQAGDINMINPEPWKLGEGYKWTGETSVALESERGNSDTDEWDIAAKTSWRSLVDRYRVSFAQEIDKNEGDKTSDNWNARLNYDRFFKSDPDNYWGLRTWFEYDRFQDLDLRTTVGPYLGRHFLKKPILSVQGELGPVWVDEQFDVAEDDDYPGALWDFEVTSNVIGFGTTLYIEHDGILNFDSPDDLILNTRFGIRMPLIYGFQTAIEGFWEYDGGAVDDVDDLDETYNFRIGYAW